MNIPKGSKFTRLEVTDSIPVIEKGRKRWKCLCVCGSRLLVLGFHLKSGDIKSCGCLRRDGAKERSTSHGLHHHPLYVTWKGIIGRCYHPKASGYHNYGEKGITVCDEWRSRDTGLRKFIDWAELNGWYDGCGLSLDKDIKGGMEYSPENCVWATRKEQARNKTNNVVLTWKGESHCMIEWSEILGIKYQTLRHRIKKLNWDVDKAFTTPTKRINQ